MTALNKQARLVSSARISEIANGANLIMGEKEWLANTAIYLANELKTATKAFQSTGFSLLEAEAKLEAAEKRIAELEARDKPKFVQCWSCKHDIEVLAIADCDGYCPRCAAPIDLDDEPYAAAGKGE